MYTVLIEFLCNKRNQPNVHWRPLILAPSHNTEVLSCIVLNHNANWMFVVFFFFFVSSHPYWILCLVGILSLHTPHMVCGLWWPKPDTSVRAAGGCEKGQHSGKAPGSESFSLSRPLTWQAISALQMHQREPHSKKQWPAESITWSHERLSVVRGQVVCHVPLHHVDAF